MMFEGDTVRLIGNDPSAGYIGIGFLEEMKKYVGMRATITEASPPLKDGSYIYGVEGVPYWWHESWLELEEPEELSVEGLNSLESLFEM